MNMGSSWSEELNENELKTDNLKGMHCMHDIVQMHKCCHEGGASIAVVRQFFIAL